MIKDSLIDRELTEGDINDLRDLVKLVISRHFLNYLYGNTSYEDYFNLGLETCIHTLKSGKYTKERGKLFSFLYTGVRFAIGNYISKIKRVSCVEDELLTELNSSRDTSNIRVDDIDIYRILKKLPKKEITKDKLYKIKSYLTYIGIEVEAGSYDKSGEIYEEVEKEVALIIWDLYYLAI